LGAKRATIELWRAMVPQRNIMKQLGMSKAPLMRVLLLPGPTPPTPSLSIEEGSNSIKLLADTLDLMKKKLRVLRRMDGLFFREKMWFNTNFVLRSQFLRRPLHPI